MWSVHACSRSFTPEHPSSLCSFISHQYDQTLRKSNLIYKRSGLFCLTVKDCHGGEGLVDRTRHKPGSRKRVSQTLCYSRPLPPLFCLKSSVHKKCDPSLELPIPSQLIFSENNLIGIPRCVLESLSCYFPVKLTMKIVITFWNKYNIVLCYPQKVDGEPKDWYQLQALQSYQKMQ